MEDLQKKYLEACKVFVDQEKIKDEVIGIIVAGSFIYSTLDKNSDIDIHVILDSECKYRERGNTWINGIEVEYFKNPPAQIRSYFEKETKSPHTAHMLADGKIVYQNSEIIDDLIATAKSIMQQKPPELKPFEIELNRYFIDDIYKDLEDTIINQDVVAAKIIRHKIVDRCIEVFCKVYQIRREKDKRLRKQLEQLDPDFQKKTHLAIVEEWKETSAVQQLRNATENLLGGPRTKEWKLRSQLDL